MPASKTPASRRRSFAAFRADGGDLLDGSIRGWPRPRSPPGLQAASLASGLRRGGGGGPLYRRLSGRRDAGRRHRHARRPLRGRDHPGPRRHPHPRGADRGNRLLLGRLKPGERRALVAAAQAARATGAGHLRPPRPRHDCALRDRGDPRDRRRRPVARRDLPHGPDLSPSRTPTAPWRWPGWASMVEWDFFRRRILALLDGPGCRACPPTAAASRAIRGTDRRRPSRPYPRQPRHLHAHTDPPLGRAWLRPYSCAMFLPLMRRMGLAPEDVAHLIRLKSLAPVAMPQAATPPEFAR